ncbi:cytoplasmic incompatibility factor CifB [Wolbachia endosymbiont (group B) of Rhopobota naevana]|uniref:cytoplasmic incompatibility factor CifB n=1 Tax=Wolbachia endosymbiont (group B) of Rhopobota naevana TaxID=2954054 RepID=UPI0029D41AA6|nr:cytoplasmic incompatibility factor CifB [Wolbachia endosymbiont (group B) of Rhopobota naevana]
MSNGDGFVRSLVDGDLEGFRQRFESFLDKCPSFLHYVNAGRFLPICFFSMFATAHDANILNANERVYFRFDNHGVNPRNGENRNTGNLKIAVYRDGQQVVRCYSISDRPNSDGLRFSERERDFLVQEIIRQNQGLMEEDLNFEQYKVCMHGKGKSQGEAIATVFEVIREKDFRGRDKFAKYSASEVHFLRQLFRNHRLTIKEIGGRQLNQNQLRQLGRSVNFTRVEPGQQRIDNFMEMLASNQRQDVRDSLRGDILEYVTDTYNNYRAQIENNIEGRSQKFESHGFLLGFLANFSHLCTIDIDLDLSPRNSHVAFLVRHQAERENIPIVINLAIFDTPSDVALNCAIGYAGRLHTSSFIPIHTTSEHTVCVGLNFNLNIDPFSVDIVGLQQDRFPLVQRLFECLENEGIRENIRDFLLHHLPAEIPRNAENYDRIFDCITGFAFGNSAFDRHPLELEEEDEAPITKYIFRHGDEGLRCLTMVFHAEGSDIVILHIRAHDAQQQGAINLQTLNVNGNDVHVWEVSCTLNNQLELDIDLPNDLGLYHDYQNNNANNFLAGDLVQVPNTENVHNTLNQVVNDGWKNIAQHRGLFQEISGALMPLVDTINVNSEDKFRSILHGTFYASDNPYKVLAMYKVGQTYSLKRGQEEEGERVILTRITEQRLDLLLLRQPRENDLDTHPIGYVLRLANNSEEVGQQQNDARQEIGRLKKQHRGFIPITSGNEVVLFPIVFNRDAHEAGNLILFPEGIGREEHVHRLDRHVRSSRPGGLVGPESVIDENPPEGLLSDQTRENLINYVRENPGRSRILPFDLGDNRCVSIITFEGSIQQLLEILRSRIREGGNAIPTAQGIRRQIRDILGNQGIEVNDLLTLEFATRNGHYDYWLQQIDIAHAGRLQYQLRTEGNHTFEVANLARNDGNEHIVRVLNQFRENEEQQRLTLIITLNNTHWVTLVIEHQNGNYVGYYADSTATAVPGGITDIIQNNLDNNIRINNVSVSQQTDGWNCGLWALENASDINRVLNENPVGQVQNIINIIRDFLGRDHPNRDRNYFQNMRVGISQLFRNDPGFQGVQLRAYIQNRGQIDPLLRTYLELGYHRVGGGCGPVEAPISLSVSDYSNFGGLPQSSLEGPEASRVSDLSRGKGGR